MDFRNERGEPDNHFLRKLKRIALHAGLIVASVKQRSPLENTTERNTPKSPARPSPSAFTSTYTDFARRARLAGRSTGFRYAPSKHGSGIRI